MIQNDRLEGLPAPAGVEGGVHTELRAGEQEPSPLRIFPHHPGEVVLGNAVPAVGEGAPRGAVVVGREEIGAHVPTAVPIGCDVHPARSVG
jgi:hypothetical protein